MDDLVASEFALRLELSGSASSEDDTTSTFVDFEKLREQLDARLVELDAGAGASKIAEHDRAALRERARVTAASLERAAEKMAPKEPVDDAEEDEEEETSTSFLEELQRRTDAVTELGWFALRGPPRDRLRANVSAVMYVRSDGSVDWEGALQGAKAATAFSVDLWKRINGVQEGAEDEEAEGEAE